MSTSLKANKEILMLKRIMTAIKAQLHIEPIKDPKEIKRVYKHYRVRMLYTMMAGYGAFYLVKKELFHGDAFFSS